MNNIVDRYNDINAIVRQAAQTHQGNPDRVRLLPVSKRFPASDIRVLAGIGCLHFGENYVQEAIEKMALLSDLPIEWHFIGPIQSNKTKDIAAHFHWVHSVDRLKIAQRLSAQRDDALPPLQVCIQVNISNEPQKSGVALEQVSDLAQAIHDLPGITLRGLMAIPAQDLLTAERERQYHALKAAQRALQAYYPDCDTLSLGMSDDLDQAIACGSTLVRVGTAIFGHREDPGAQVTQE